jgi:hypothetical protein
MSTVTARSAAVLGALLILPITTASTRPDGRVSIAANCQVCDNVEGQHHFHPQSCTTGTYCYDCEIFNSCHDNYQAGTCNQYHWHCGIQEDDAEAALSAATMGDAARLLKLMDAHPDNIRVNASRSLLQVLNCQKAVVAQVPLTKVLVETLTD